MLFIFILVIIDNILLILPVFERIIVFNIPFFSDMIEAVVVSGSIYSELSLHYQSGSVHPRGSFVHTIRLYHEHNGRLHVGDNKSNNPGSFSYSKGIFIENNFDFGDQDNHRDLDLYMRINSKIKNRGPTFYTDQNGFQMQRRKKFSGLGNKNKF